MDYIFGAIIGYFFGCINMAGIIAKKRGINIKAVGSKNAGASNVFISVGKLYGIFVGACDVLKSFFAAYLTFVLFGGNKEAALVAGAMAVLGHNFPFWMHFNGGKGLAPFMGLVLFYDWRVFLVFVVVIAAATLITDFIVIGTFSVTVLMPLFTALIAKDNFAFCLFFLLCVLIWYRHRENMKRIANGTEIGFLRKNKPKK